MSGINRASINRSAINREGSAGASFSATLVAVPLVAANLTAQIKLNAPTMTAVGACAGALTTQIKLVSQDMLAAAVLAAALTTQINLNASSVAVPVQTGALTTQIKLNAGLVSAPTQTGNLRTQAGLFSSMQAYPLAASDLQTNIRFETSMQAVAIFPLAAIGSYYLYSTSFVATPSLSPDLTHKITFIGSPASTPVLSSNLYVPKDIEASASTDSTMAAGLTAQIKLSASHAAVTGFINPELYIPKQLASAQYANPTLNADITAGIQLASNISATSGFIGSNLTEAWFSDFSALPSLSSNLTTILKFNSGLVAAPAITAPLTTLSPIVGDFDANATLSAELTLPPRLFANGQANAVLASGLTTIVYLNPNPVIAVPKLWASMTTIVLTNASSRAIPCFLVADLSVVRSVDIDGVDISAQPGSLQVSSSIVAEAGSSSGSVPLSDYFEAFFGNPNNWVANSPNPVFGVYRFNPNIRSFSMSESMPIMFITPDDPADNPTIRKKFTKIEYHGTGTALMRVFVDNLLIARYPVNDAENPEKSRVIRLPSGTTGYNLRIEMVGYFVLNYLEYTYDTMTKGSA